MGVFLQQLSNLKEMFCFPPIPMISKLLKHLEQEKVSCVILVPQIWEPWSNLLHKHTLATVEIAKPYEGRAFSVTHGCLGDTGRIFLGWSHFIPWKVRFTSNLGGAPRA